MATKTDARDALDSNEGSELTAIAVKSLTNLEEKVEAIDWKFHNHKHLQQTLQVKLQRL